MSCNVSIVLSAQRIDLKERALLREQRPVCEEILTMDADPCTNLHLVIAIKFSSQFLARCNVKRILPPCMTCMQMRFLVTLTLFRAHRYENAVEQ